MKYPILNLSFLLIFLLTQIGCGEASSNQQDPSIYAPKAEKVSQDPMKNKGIGPIKSVELGEINAEMAEEGKVIFEQMCVACHKATERFIGPAPKGITERRTPEWIMNMILNPDEMVQKDPIAKQLLIEYNLSPMANQNLTEEQARKVLEYFRTL